MRTLARFATLLLFLLSGCNFPNAGQTATDTPTVDVASIECGFVWARESLADLSEEFDAALKASQPGASGYAEAYGENCISPQGEVVRFLPMETDFHTNLKVEDLNNKQALGEGIEQILSVIAKFPVEQTPGPQPGYVGITFEANGEEIQLWFTQVQAQSALENGLRGEQLFNALQAR